MKVYLVWVQLRSGERTVSRAFATETAARRYLGRLTYEAQGTVSPMHVLGITAVWIPVLDVESGEEEVECRA